ncbi:MAG: cell wall-binding repeat-containing protein [Clostridium sp.]|uniref:cell wall-binding repeat-containing protein n=1 Tax=Clostridium sp. TaxID=1506 RepID=UPI0025BA9A23|nr:cell wall-binding repeat-containing protein [Clostridium sp.]MCH3963636.1 cell wall-binding repeat-containing protein [Clostridium sp.]MCI1714777.1 cell wall-binding repeat-containing protein [Clostridium sp.]MCI1799034.1 cell wall-binding repeat-containing protein [Clostridium sp.]MCI1812960.1 cell wall-binding repeat-containing protein [Clostridium sp.]MCI1869850.1 cell wall-binding repeat-containing protein [Clostridium sp.]
MKKIIAVIMLICLIAGVSGSVYAEGDYSVSRIYGKDRYETSQNIAYQFGSEKLENVIVASGTDFPDALSGSLLSKKLNAPILLAGKDTASHESVMNFIKDRLNLDGTVYILGGEASVDKNFYDSLKAAGYKNVRRLGGIDRFETNSMIVDSMNVEKGKPVIFVNGLNFPDALSVSSIAASKSYPIIMSSSEKLYGTTKDILKKILPDKIYVVGGTGVINNGLIDELKATLPALTEDEIIRIGGENRYATSLNLCRYFNLDSDTAIIAGGNNFADALSGSALAAKMNSPIILTDDKDIYEQRQYLDDSNYKKFILLGGTGAISEGIESDLKSRFYISDGSAKALLTDGENAIKDLLDIEVDGNSYIDISGISYAPLKDNTGVNSIYNYLNSNYGLNKYYTDSYINNFISFEFKNINGRTYMRYGNPESAVVLDNCRIIDKRYDDNEVYMTIRGYNYTPEDTVDIDAVLIYNGNKWLIEKFNNWGIE